MKKRIVIFLMVTGLAACNQQPEEVLPRHSSSPVTGMDAGDQIALNLSQQLADGDVRALIREKLVQKFDGDYNFLLALHLKDQLPDTRNMADVLNPYESGQGLEEILLSDPLLQIAMPTLSDFSAEDWDTDVQIPIVVYRPPEIDLNTVPELPAYRNGVRFMMDLTKEPEEPVVVISHNERTVAVPRGELPYDKLAPAAENCSPSAVGDFGGLFFYLKEALEQCYGTGDLPVGTPSDEGCDRDRALGKDHITRARFTTMNYMREAEHYLDGNPEVYFIVTLASKNPSGFASLRKSFPSTDRSQWKDCGLFSCVPEWHEHLQPVFRWDKEVFGDLVRYDWFEEDFSTAKIDITLGLTSKFENVSVSGNVKITISKKDYFLDQDFVNYCDETDHQGTDYNTGKLYFTVNNQ